MSPIDRAWLILKVDDRAIRADEAASEMVRRAQREENRKKEMKDWANQLRGNAPFDMKDKHSGAMREALIPEDRENPVVKYPLDFRRTRLGQLPINMAISRALANMDYPILPETPYDYDDVQGFRVQQPQVTTSRDGDDISYEDWGNAERDIKDRLEGSGLSQLLAPDTQSGRFGTLDTHRGNIGFHEGKPVNFDPRYAAEMSSPLHQPLENSYWNINNRLSDPWKRPYSDIPNLKDRLQQVKDAKDEIPEFLEEYRKPGFFDDWINAQENQQIIPDHQKQLDEGLANYRNYGNALEFHNTLVNDPAQTRLYEFSDPAYARRIQQLQEMAQ